MKPIKLAVENFDNEVKLSEKPVLIDFYADWCGPCKMLAPIIEELANELTDTKVCKVNVDEQPEIASSFGVMSIPTVVVIKEGNYYKKAVGYQSKDKLMKLLA
ncbi:MAG: thioredoxin [Clostridia bacterium]|nr:thioredoxin [Clostridia bacterium]